MIAGGAPVPDSVAEDSPYVGLSYFTEDRAELFFGRDTERTTIIGNLRAARLTLLYAESGVGKSSLLRAGVAARLGDLARRSAERGSARLIPVVFSSWRDDPVPALIGAAERAIEPYTTEPSVELPREGLEAALETAAAATDATLLVILDQFEEYFLYGSREHQAGRFADELARCVNRRDLHANFLIAVREDAYAGLGSLFRGRIVNVYANFLRLEYLDLASARSAIVGPVDHYNAVHPDGQPVRIEPELIDAVLDQVRKGSVSFDQAGKGRVTDGDAVTASVTRIETPYLQLVMTTLWEQERAAGSPVLRRSTLDALGGAQEIVHTHLNGALDGLPERQREIAVKVFDHLVTPSGAKIVHKTSDLARYADAPETEVQALVESLASGRQRILRPVPAPSGEEDGGPRVEIFHDVLAPAILAWRSEQTRVRLERERREAETQGAHERRRARVFRTLAIVSGVLLVIAILAFVQARVETGRARNAQRAAVSYQLQREAQTEFQNGALSTGVLLSLEGYRYAASAGDPYGLSEATDGLVQSSVATDAIQRMFAGYNSAVTTLAFSPDGKRLATGTAAGQVVIQDERDRSVTTLPGSSSINEVAFSPDGKTLATANVSGSVRLWDLATRRPRLVLDGRTGGVNTIAFSPDGTRLAAGDADGTVIVWNPRSGRPVRTLHGHGGAINDVKFSQNGAALAAADEHGTVILWDATTGRRRRTLHGHTDAATAVAFSPGGSMLASSGDDGQILIWNARTGQKLRTLSRAAYLDDLAFSPDGRTIAAAADDDSVVIYDARTGRQLRVLHGHTAAVDSVAFNPTGTLLASSGQDDLVMQSYMKPPFLRRALTGNRGPVYGVAASSNGRLIASAGHDGTVRIWEAATGHVVHVLRGHAGAVEAVAFSPDGKTLVSANQDKAVIEWNVATGRRLRTLRGQTNIVYAVAYSPDGTEIASGGADASVVVWNSATGQRRETLKGHTDSVYSVAFSPDGRTLASGSADKSIDLWNLGTGRRLRRLVGHTAAVEGVAFSPDGRELASVSLDGTAILWDVSTGDQLGDPLRGHDGGLISVAFSGSGSTIITGGLRDSLIVWDLASRLGEPYVAQTGPVTSLAFTPQGSTIVSGSADGTVDLIGALPTQTTAASFAARLCELVRRNLTHAQWSQFVPAQQHYRRTCPSWP